MDPSIQQFFPPTSSSLRTGSFGSSSPNKSSPPLIRSISLDSSNSVDEVLSAGSDSGILRPVAQAWVPTHNYEDINIGGLVPGPQSVCLTGRIVNIGDQPLPRKTNCHAEGCLKLILKDCTGAITIRLWYINPDYKLQLGHLVSIWTTHVSTGQNWTLSVSTAPLFTEVFPERDRSCHLMVKNECDTTTGTLCKTPLGYRVGQPLQSLLTLQEYIDGGHDLVDARIAVVVKALGHRKTITTKKGKLKQTQNVVLFDHTANAMLVLRGLFQLVSAEKWTPSRTILLISNANLDNGRKPYITLSSSSFIDIDPEFEDAFWLRNWAINFAKHQHINPRVPENVFDLESWQTSERKALFTVADANEFVRVLPDEAFIGFLSVVVLDLHLAELHVRCMLFCDECCGIAMYSNNLFGICKQCQKPHLLRINPKVVGVVLDESGSVNAGKLVFSQRAYTELFGRDEQDIANATADSLRHLEQRIAGLRVSLIFGWPGQASIDTSNKLCVLGVRE